MTKFRPDVNEYTNEVTSHEDENDQSESPESIIDKNHIHDLGMIFVNIFPNLWLAPHFSLQHLSLNLFDGIHEVLCIEKIKRLDNSHALNEVE